jgi:hypothetical protein
MNGFEAPLGHSTNFLLMNKESLAKLPADARMGKAGNEETTPDGARVLAAYKAELAKVATTAKN